MTLIDARNHHLFQPLLYQVATGILSEGEVAPPLRDILRRHGNVDVELAEVTGFDLDARTVHRAPTRRHGAHVSVRQPDRRRRGRPVVLRPRRVRPLRAGHEDDRRRARAARRGSSARSRWPRPSRTRRRGAPGSPSWWSAAARPGSRSRARSRELARTRPAGQLPPDRPGRAPQVLLVDGGKEILATFGDRLSAKAAAGAATGSGVELRSRSHRHGRRPVRGRRARRGRDD